MVNVVQESSPEEGGEEEVVAEVVQVEGVRRRRLQLRLTKFLIRLDMNRAKQHPR